MRLLKQALAVLGSVVVIAIIAALVTPKTAHAIIATAVQVVNTPSQPVPTLATDALTAFDVSGSCNFGSGSVCDVLPIYTVPAGQIGVIESASGQCFINTGSISGVNLTFVSGGSFTIVNLERTKDAAGGGAVYTWTHSLKSYASGGGPTGTTIDAKASSDSNQSGIFPSCEFEVAGHLVTP